jgi:hypothetical protein
MPDFAHQVAGGLQPQPLACQHEVDSVEHQPRKHDLPSLAFLGGWQRNDDERFWVIRVLHVFSKNVGLPKTVAFSQRPVPPHKEEVILLAPPLRAVADGTVLGA